VKEKMICPYCKKETVWCENKEVYGKNYGKSYMIYLCKPCDAYVGCHNNTKRPLGTMANKELRMWRGKAHANIDPIWKSGKMTRKDMYGFLSKTFGFDIHVAESDIDMCKKLATFNIHLD